MQHSIFEKFLSNDIGAYIDAFITGTTINLKLRSEVDESKVDGLVHVNDWRDVNVDGLKQLHKVTALQGKLTKIPSF